MSILATEQNILPPADTATELVTYPNPVVMDHVDQPPDAFVDLPGDTSEALAVRRAFQAAILRRGERVDAEIIHVEAVVGVVVCRRIAGSTPATLAIERPTAILMASADATKVAENIPLSKPIDDQLPQEATKKMSAAELFDDDDDEPEVDMDTLLAGPLQPDPRQEIFRQGMVRQSEADLKGLIAENGRTEEPRLTVHEASLVIDALKEGIVTTADRAEQQELKIALHDMRIQAALGRLRQAVHHLMPVAERLPEKPRHRMAVGIAALVALTRAV